MSLNATALASPDSQTVTMWERALLIAGLLGLYAPTYAKLSEQVWSQEGQGHGPVMLALTLWLVWQRRATFAETPISEARVPGLVLLCLGALLYVLGRSQDFPEIEAASQFFVFSALLSLYWGWGAVRAMALPLFFLIFLIPLPPSLVAILTAPLKAGVSYVAEQLLYVAGYPIGRSGVTLTVGPYRLLVADACAGLNSIFALEAVGVFYLSLMNYQSRLRNALIAILIIPISFVSNVIRVIVLVLVTYHFGDEAGQGFVHDFAGIMLFVIATVLTVMADKLIGYFVSADAHLRSVSSQ